MKFDKKYINTRITVIVVIAAIAMIAIISRAVYVATVQNEEWKKVGAVSVSDTMPFTLDTMCTVGVLRKKPPTSTRSFML